jgi:hypothetical protein
MQNFYQSTWEHETLYADRASEDEQLLTRPYSRKTKNANMAGGWNLKLTFWFMETTHTPLHLEKLSLVQWKIMDRPTCFISIIVFFNGPFEYGDAGILKLLRWMLKLHQSTWDHNILYADKS